MAWDFSTDPGTIPLALFRVPRPHHAMAQR